MHGSALPRLSLAEQERLALVSATDCNCVQLAEHSCTPVLSFSVQLLFAASLSIGFFR